jgi:hypothetical protein
MTIATIRATEELAAEIRYRIAQRLDLCPCKQCRVFVTASRVAGQEYTWRVQAA